MASNLVLASASARRRDLLALTGLPFQTFSVEVDETREPDEDPAVYVMRLSLEKARAAAARLPAGMTAGPLVLAADTAVVDGPDVLGKPQSQAEAEGTLRRLRGGTHHVLTAITVLDRRDDQALTELCRTEVPMRAYRDDEIAAYVATGDPLDKAGSYAIQHRGFRPVGELSNCYANVMGLPLCHLTRMLRHLGLPPPADVPAACRAFTAYQCPVYERILEYEL